MRDLDLEGWWGPASVLSACRARLSVAGYVQMSATMLEPSLFPPERVVVSGVSCPLGREMLVPLVSTGGRVVVLCGASAEECAAMVPSAALFRDFSCTDAEGLAKVASWFSGSAVSEADAAGVAGSADGAKGSWLSLVGHGVLPGVAAELLPSEAVPGEPWGLWRALGEMSDQPSLLDAFSGRLSSQDMSSLLLWLVSQNRIPAGLAAACWRLSALSPSAAAVLLVTGSHRASI